MHSSQTDTIRERYKKWAGVERTNLYIQIYIEPITEGWTNPIRIIFVRAIRINLKWNLANESPISCSRLYAIGVLIVFMTKFP